MDTFLLSEPPHVTSVNGQIRLKIRFPGSTQMNAALAAESLGAVAVQLGRRNIVSVALSEQGYSTASSQLAYMQRGFGATITEDYRYELESTEFFDPSSFSPELPEAASLDDVTREIGAEAVWGITRGRNVIIAVVDTGIDGNRPEFPHKKRVSESWAPIGEDPWTDWQGHGTMCAAIAAGTKEHGGRFNGIAPDARLMSCRTRFYDSELAAIYDQLTSLAAAGHLVIATNSFGMRTGSPPPVPEDSDFIPALNDAVAAGVKVFFSAGNYHELVGGAADGDEPNSIWLHKGRADVMAVGACDQNKHVWAYSSRGPGQHFGDEGTNEKPDVVGLTPANGRIVFGSGVVSMPRGWGTSGCCPQAAGLAALISSFRAARSQEPLSTTELFDLIRSTATSVSHGWRSRGAGLVNCTDALTRMAQ